VPEEDLNRAHVGLPGAAHAGSGISRHLVWLLVGLTYLTVFPYYQQINNPNENARIWMVRAIVDFHELSINRACQQLGYVNDKVIVNGRLYSGKAPGTSFVGVPIYAAQRTVARWLGITTLSQRSVTLALRLFGVGLPLVIFLFFFARYVERLTGSAAARDLLVVGLGLGTMLYPYGVIFVGHALAAALAFAGFMIVSLEPVSAPRRNRLGWAGALVGLSVLFEYQVAIAAVIVAAYTVARHRREAFFFLLGTVPAALLFGAYHAVVFGRPWELPFGHIENPNWAGLPKQVGFPGLHAIGGVLFSIDMGLFVFSPFLLLGVLGAIALVARGERLEGAAILAVTAGMVCFLASLPNWHAGWCVGPRYIAVVAPFLSAGVAYAWRRARRLFVLSALTAGLVIPSVLLNVVSGAVYPHYPEAFDNPVFDLTLPLLTDGYLPYSAGWLVGLPGLLSLSPLAALTLTAMVPGVAGRDPRLERRLLHAGLAVIMAAAFLLPLSRYGRAPRPAEDHATALVRSTWNPAPRAPRTGHKE
jgi:hypothetical protein